MLFKKLTLSAFFVFAAISVAQTPVSCSNMTVGTNGALNGFVPSPNDAWHQDITNAPIDPNSAKIITTSGDLGGAKLHPDFSNIVDGAAGIPYTVVDSSVTPGVPVPITAYPDESDITLNPIPANLPVEGSPAQCTTTGDNHAIILDRNGCVAYELWQAVSCNSGWTASTSAIWDLTTTEKRPYGYTSTDAAGLSIFEGLIRYDEIVAGVINHAIRFTALHTKSDAHLGYFTAPATHAAGNNSVTDNIMGMRIRLQANFDISGYSSTNQIILKAMKQYGMILADNGSNLFFQGTPDARWNDSDLNALKAVPATAFDVVQMGPLYDASTAPTGPAPVITSFTASASTVASGTAVTLTPTVTGASYSYIDKVGFIRGPVTINPTVTTTYTLTSRNAFGTTSASTTVTVQAATSTPTLQFAAISTQAFGAAPFAVSATSASSGAVTYSVVSGPATVAGSTVTLTGAGTVQLMASQAAAGTYSAATASTSFTVNPGNPALAFVAISNQTYGAAPFAVATTTKSSGSISYAVVSGPATVSGNSVTLTGVGTVQLQANEAAAGNYAAATATTSFNVSTAAATLTFATIPAKTFGAAPFTVSATSASSGAVTYSVISGPASISGNTVTLTAVGTVTLQASQAAAGNYAAGTAMTNFVVSAATPTLTFTAIPAKTFGAAPFTVSATSASSGTVTYSVVSGPATISASTVTLTGTGTVTLQAQQAASGNYAVATATVSFTVSTASSSSLTLAAIPNQTYGVAPFPVSATSPSPAAITYTVTVGHAYLSGNVLTITGVGPVTVQAHQAASGTYPTATVTTSFTVAGEAPGLAITPIANHFVGDPTFDVASTTSSWGAITYTIVSGPAILPYSHEVHVTGPGTVVVQAVQAAYGNYASATTTTSFIVTTK
jgi:hypothetical protein